MATNTQLAHRHHHDHHVDDGVKSVHVPGFLRLSPEIRHSIYHLVWSTPWPTENNGYQINLFFERSMPDVFDLRGPYDASTKTYNIPPVGFYGLLLSCRAINAETSALLYSSNRFFCHYEASHSLAPLRELRPESVASLTNLKIVLNQASCHSRTAVGGSMWQCCDEKPLFDVYYPSNGRKRRRYYRRCHENEHDPPLRRSLPFTRPMLAEWYKTAAHLGPLITPGQLELSFVCDVYGPDIQLATMVLDAFRHFPPLKDCHIRLSRTPNPALRDLARTTVLRTRGIQSRLSLPGLPPPPPPTVSRLIGLPRELRLRILEYTDLVTPLKEVMWTRVHGRYMASRPYCPSWEGRGNHGWLPEVHHGCQFSHCSQRLRPEDSIGCYCQLTHAAASSTCRCWATPTALFLVSHILRHDANLVFFSENRFVVIDSPSLPVFGPPRESGYDQTRFAVSQFLKDVVPAGCLSHLRLVEMVFPPYIAGHWPQKGDAVLKDWSDTIDQVKDELNLPALTIRMLAVYHDDEDDDANPPLTGSEAKETLDAYFHVLFSANHGPPTGTCRRPAPCSSVGLHAARGPRWPNAERRSPRPRSSLNGAGSRSKCSCSNHVELFESIAKQPRHDRHQWQAQISDRPVIVVLPPCPCCAIGDAR
ncbi:hypothetical protein B0I37DRAFT_332985 [Chaetomium sp. MPI-CAGE-AT-0009]|nr:hypothetical protein B0I37DRAFT_332985 [Chaetomium sp. MPI-CAGE-AT-0009]